MKLEAIDPLNLSAICVATIRKVKAYIWGDKNEEVEVAIFILYSCCNQNQQSC